MCLGWSKNPGENKGPCWVFPSEGKRRNKKTEGRDNPDMGVLFTEVIRSVLMRGSLTKHHKEAQ